MRTGRFLLILASIGSFATVYGGDTLYRRIGGREALRPMVSDFVEMVSKDQKFRMNSSARKFLDHVNPTELKEQIMAVVCEAAQGPCKGQVARIYLKRVLQDIELTPFDWGAVNADFEAAMVKFKVAPADQDELRGFFARARAWVPPKAPPQ